MEAEMAKCVAVDDHLAEAPREDKYGHYELSKDYAANGQIMVTITLAEYRELLRQHAADQVTEANSKRWAAEKERDELKKQVTDLQRQLAELRGMIASAMPVKVSVDTGDE